MRFLEIITSCFPPNEHKRKQYKLHQMRQAYIESNDNLAKQFDICDIDLQTLEPLDDKDTTTRSIALAIKHWLTRNWDAGCIDDLPPSEIKKIHTLSQSLPSVDNQYSRNPLHS